MRASLIPLVYRMLHATQLQECWNNTWSPLPEGHADVPAGSAALEDVWVLWVRNDEVQHGDV